jgi:hypothetical protein
MKNTNQYLNDDLGSDLRITKTTRRASGCGTLVCGTIAGHRFDALVFPEHAENKVYEIANSRISKLWLQRIEDKQTLFKMERGSDVDAQTDLAQAIVDFLAAGLADSIYT